MTKKSEIGGALERIKGALGALRAEVSNIDARLLDINRSVMTLESAPLMLEDYGRAVEAHVRAMGDAWPGSMLAARLLSPSGMAGAVPFNKRGWRDFESADGRVRNPLPEDASKVMFFDSYSAVRAMCKLFPDRMAEAIMADVKSRIGEQWGNEDAVPVAERRTLIRDLSSERDALKARRDELRAEIDSLVGGLAG